MAKFIYYNINPLGKEEDDCVCRAISLATNTPYHITKYKLNLIADLLDCDMLCLCCYEHLIEDIYKCIPIKCKNLTVGEFADLHPYGIYLVRMEGHISVIIDNTIYDIWNCRDENITKSWLVSE